MRRSEKEITDTAEMEAVIAGADVCHVAFCDGARPYVVAMNFGYREGCIYLHSAPEGRKMDILARNDRVCVAFDTDRELVTAEEACKWTLRYRSVVAEGRAAVLDDPADRRRALEILMSHYGRGPFSFSEAALKRTAVLRVSVSRMTGKRSGHG